MRVDIAGTVRNTKLAERNAFLPLFEAIVNSMDAIEERGAGNGRIHIRLSRNTPFDLGSDTSTTEPIDTIEVVDNGIGFTRANFESFETMNSQRKAERGGRGVGRLMWLKAFESVAIESTYAEDGAWYHRSFRFYPTAEGIAEPALKRLSGSDLVPDEPRTAVKLITFKKPFRRAISADSLARRIVEHCLEFYLLDTAPFMVLEDTSLKEVVELSAVFRDDAFGLHEPRQFTIGDQTFTLRDVLLRRPADRKHLVHFCANSRVVEALRLDSRIAHLQGPLDDGSGPSGYYHAYVSSAALDSLVDAERQSFTFAEDDTEGTLSRPALESAALKAVQDFITPRTANLRDKSFARVSSFVETQEPKYRPLLSARRAEIENIPSNATETEMDLRLHSVLQEWKQSVRGEASTRLKQHMEDPESFESFKKGFAKVLGEMNEVAKSELADYVQHRATVLQFFEKLLGVRGDGKFSREDALHSFLFPQRKTSDEVDLDQHNLWVLDERLVYHKYLASDIRFDRQSRSPAQVESPKRPDIIVYNRTFAFTPTESAPFSSVILFEFKKPERNDYPETDNPVDQVLGYVDAVRSGKARKDDGSTVAVPQDASFYCYIIATLTPNVRRLARNANLTRSPDGDGFFGYNQAARAFIEILSHQKVLADAKRRNKVFFDKLNIQLR